MTPTTIPRRADAPFAKLPTEVVRDDTLSDRAKLLLAEINTYAWESSGNGCWAAQATLASDLGWSVRKVQRAAKELLLAGRITVQRSNPHGGGRTNTYHPCRISSDTDGGSDPTAVSDQIRRGRRTKKTTASQMKRTTDEGKGTRGRAPDPPIPTPKDEDFRADAKFFHRGGWFYLREIKELEEREMNARLRGAMMGRPMSATVLKKQQLDDARERAQAAAERMQANEGGASFGEAPVRVHAQMIRDQAVVERAERLRRDMEAIQHINEHEMIDAEIVDVEPVRPDGRG